MKLATFIADDAETALARIENELGTDAVVVSVRRMPAQGLSRLWNGNRQIEVIAGIPDENPASSSSAAMAPTESIFDAIPANRIAAAPSRAWRSLNQLETWGLIPECADFLEAKARSLYGETPPDSLDEEWVVVRSIMIDGWRSAPPAQTGSGRPHVFIGPPGSGKTTALCKWMTRAVLAENCEASAWRLDGNVANASEFFSLHCELIGVPVERFWTTPLQPQDYLFVDIPGTDINDPQALQTLREILERLPNPHIHLVLNAAFETALLFKHFRVFADFNPADLIFTHLDEVSNRVKLWNFVLGTNCSLSLLSAGQKIPGEFCSAEPRLLLPAVKPL